MTVERANERMNIGDFAAATGLSVSAVRFYADRGLLVPAEIDEATGYRRFDEHQVEIGELIRRCRQVKMPLRDIETMIDRSASERTALAEAHVAGLEREVADIRAHLRSFAGGDTDPSHVDAAVLHRAIGDVLRSAGVDPERPDFMCVRIEVRQGSLRLVATDRYRLAMRDLVLVGAGAPFAATMSTAAMERVRDGLAGATGVVSISAADGHVRVAGAGIDLSAEPLLVDFPDYERFLDPIASPVASAVVMVQNLVEALEASTGPHVLVTVGDGSISIATSDGRRSVAAVATGPSAACLLDMRYAIDALDSALGDEVAVEIRTDDVGVIFRSADDGTAVSVVMPVLDAEMVATLRAT